MIRLGLLLLLVLVAPLPARAEPPPQTPTFDAGLAGAIYGAALGFIAPRTLEAVTVSELTLWGLRGLTALDPDLVAEVSDDHLRLSHAQRLVYSGPVPAKQDPALWALAAVHLTEAGLAASEPLRRAGTEGIVQAFFGELFNHLDPYSRYVSPTQAAADEAQRWGRAGIGVSLARRGAAVVVSAVAAGGPAAEAGLRRGDRIVSVDEQRAAGQSTAVVGAWLAGPDGSTVRLKWSSRGRSSGGGTRTATLTREIVPPETVFAQHVSGLLVIRLAGFSRSTDVSFAEAVQQALASPHPPEGLVVDLRGNRGGLLAEAVTVADQFLSAGLVAITEGRDPAATRLWRSARGELARDVPVVVLVDGRTASAAEILAAALADRGRAVVVGSSTLGKGLVQTFTTLPGGGELFVTWSRVLAPRGWPIQGLGVLPQVCTSRGEETLLRQLSELSAGVQPMADALAKARDARAPVPPAEVVGIRDVCPAAEGRQTDLDVARFLVDNPAAYAAALLPPLGTPITGP